MRLRDKLKKIWENWDEFDKYFFSTLLTLLIITIFMTIFFPRSLDGPLKWISETFSVPLIQDKSFHISAGGILFLFIIVVVLLGWGVNRLIKFVWLRLRKGR